MKTKCMKSAYHIMKYNKIWKHFYFICLFYKGFKIFPLAISGYSIFYMSGNQTVNIALRKSSQVSIFLYQIFKKKKEIIKLHKLVIYYYRKKHKLTDDGNMYYSFWGLTSGTWEFYALLKIHSIVMEIIKKRFKSGICSYISRTLKLY